MKRSITLLAAILFTTCLAAQPLQNHLYLSGSIGFGSQSGSTKQGATTTDNATTTVYNFSPAIGYTFRDNILLGIRANIMGSKVDVPGGSTTKVNGAGAALFGRYYIPIEERFLFYPELLVGFGNQKTETTDQQGVTVTNPNANTFMIGILAGFAYYPSTHWGVELTTGALGFASTTSTNKTTDPNIETTTNQFGLGINGLMVNVGVSYLIQLGG